MVARGVASAWDKVELECSIAGTGPWWVCRLGRGVAWCGGAGSGCAGLARAFPLHGAAEIIALSLGERIVPVLARSLRSAVSVSSCGPGSRSSTKGVGWREAFLGKGTGTPVTVFLSPLTAPAHS